MDLGSVPYGFIKVLTANDGNIFVSNEDFKYRPDLWLNGRLGKSMAFDSFTMYVNNISPLRVEVGSVMHVFDEINYGRFMRVV